jgi:hypothetical protein
LSHPQLHDYAKGRMIAPLLTFIVRRVDDSSPITGPLEKRRSDVVWGGVNLGYPVTLNTRVLPGKTGRGVAATPDEEPAVKQRVSRCL